MKTWTLKSICLKFYNSNLYIIVFIKKSLKRIFNNYYEYGRYNIFVIYLKLLIIIIVEILICNSVDTKEHIIKILCF